MSTPVYLESDRSASLWQRGSIYILLLGCYAPGLAGAQAAGGSVSFTSDYVERGISKSAGQPALQLDAHVASNSGWVVGTFASNTQFQSTDSRIAELDLYAGYSRPITEDWRVRTLIGGYWYPGSSGGSDYDYVGFSVDLDYRDWLTARVTYQPNAPRVVLPNGLAKVAATFAEVSVQQPLASRLYANAGVGYAHYDGDYPLDYGYFSAGVDYERSPLSLSVGYVASSPGAKSLYYNGYAGARWVGTLVFRF